MFAKSFCNRWSSAAPPSKRKAFGCALSLAAFIAAYTALDWASFISPLRQLNLTPWNPAPALGILYILRRGKIAVPALFLAIVASDIFIRGMPDSFLFSLWLGAVLTTGYLGIARAIKVRFPEAGMFSDRYGLLIWSLIILLGTLVTSLLFVFSLLAGGQIGVDDLSSALLRSWIGDGVGMFIALPLLWWLQDASSRLLFRSVLLQWETFAYLMLTGLVLWIAFVPGADAHFRYFYVLFLPLVWAASRQGIPGAVFCVSILQLGMVLAGQLQQSPEISIFELQMRAFMLALVGFIIGIAVDEQRRSAADLRQSLRLATAGEMAGAVAHELNQPLTALSAYGDACKQLIDAGAQDERLREVVHRMTREARRAADVVRRLRDLFSSGTTELEVVSLAQLAEAAVEPFRKLGGSGVIDFRVESLPDVLLNADRLQIEVVLRNLLDNAFEAAAHSPSGRGTVVFSARTDSAGNVTIEVSDNGPGLPAAIAEQIFEPFISTKSNGLGLGLAISRAIAEAHGGALRADSGGRGCFRLTLPMDAGQAASNG